MKAAPGPTWRETGKRKAARSDCSGIGPGLRQAGVHSQVVVGVQGEGDGQGTIAAFVFHVIRLRPQIDQAGALFVGEEPNLLGILPAHKAAVEAGNRDGLLVADDRPHLFAGFFFEIRRGPVRLKGRPLVQAVGLVHESEDGVVWFTALRCSRYVTALSPPKPVDNAACAHVIGKSKNRTYGAFKEAMMKQRVHTS